MNTFIQHSYNVNNIIDLFIRLMHYTRFTMYIKLNFIERTFM